MNIMITEAMNNLADKLQKKLEVDKLADKYAVRKVKARYEYLMAKDELQAVILEANEAVVR